MGTQRDLAGMEALRLQGARLLERGVAQAEVARELNASRQAVSRWAKRLASVEAPWASSRHAHWVVRLG